MPTRRPSLSLGSLRDYVREHCFAPSDLGLIGIEIESLTFVSGDPEARPSAGQLHQAVSSAHGTTRGSVTFEPGGQVEVSTPPLPGLPAAIEAAALDQSAVSSSLRHAGIDAVPVGFDSVRPPRRILDLPRYTAMEAFFDADGSAGRTMMCSTAALQVNVDLGDRASISARWRRAHDAGPVLAACFANAPSANGGPPCSVRQHVWAGIDPSRTAPVHRPGRTDGQDPADEWLRYALDARVMLVRMTPARFEPILWPLTFRQWMTVGHDLGHPTLDDFAYHLTTLFPPVRPRGWLELRMLDTLPDPWWRVAVAVTVAVVTDPAPVEAASPLLADPSNRWTEAARSGLSHPVLHGAARRLFHTALSVLPRLGADDATLADAEAFYARFVVPGRSPGADAVSPPQRFPPGRPLFRPDERTPPRMTPRYTIEAHLQAADLRAALCDDVASGLSAVPKALPPKWFYDDRGSLLFERITRLPEYYPTRRERAILAARAGEIAELTAADTLLEIGSGTSEKTRVLLDALDDAGYLRRFVPFDVSEATLRTAAHKLASDYPAVDVHAVVGDFETHLGKLPGGGRRLVAFLGGTIGNLLPDQRGAFLRELAAGLRTGDSLLLGTDLVKDARRLRAAYDDEAGVTAEFNRNVLHVLNRELAADFDVDAFEHVAVWDADNEWIEMRLRSRREQTVHLAALDLKVVFFAGEEMRTEVSAKFRRDGVERELAAAGLELGRWWTDPAGDYALSLSFAG